MQNLETLEDRLKKLEEKLEDAEGRMPAHSVKPGQMAALFQLEEERDSLVDAIRNLRASQAD